jgi:hypothetical protein
MFPRLLTYVPIYLLTSSLPRVHCTERYTHIDDAGATQVPHRSRWSHPHSRSRTTEHCTHVGNSTERYTHTYIATGVTQVDIDHHIHITDTALRSTPHCAHTGNYTERYTHTCRCQMRNTSGHNTDRWSSHTSQVRTALRNVHCTHAGNYTERHTHKDAKWVTQVQVPHSLRHCTT